MSNISKRLFLGARKISAPGGGDDDNISVTSDTSVNTTDNSWMQRLRISNPGDDATLDEMMKNMYQDPDILEEKCKAPYGGSTKKSRSLSEADATDGLPSTTTTTTLAEEEGQGQDGAGDKADVKALSRRPSRRSSVTKMTKSPEYVIDNLDKEFFTPEFDPVLHQLTALSQWDSGELMERFMSTIEETDTDKDMVLVKLAEMIEINYSDLMECMRDVHAIDLDLTRTGFQITNSRRKLESGKKLIVTGTMDITRLSRYRNNLADVSSILSKVQGIQQLFATLQNCITIGDLGQAAESASELLVTLQNDYYNEEAGGIINAMEDFAESVQRTLPTIRQKTDKALYRLTSRKFSASEYENILKSYMILDEMQENMGVCVTVSKHIAVISSSDDAVDPSVLYDEDGCLDGFSRRVQRYHMSDIRSCLHTAVLEFMYAEQSKKEAAAAVTGGGGGGSELLDLDELSLEELYDRVTADMFVLCIVRSCELLADVVHTNYLITQWHKQPFDERNKDEAFLHRCGIDEDQSDDENEDEEGGAGGSGEEEEERQERLKNARLFDVNENLIRSRFYLWKEVELAIVEFLHNLSPTEVISLDDFVCMLWALQTFCKLGHEFGATACSPLKTGIEEQSIQYARNIHMESCQLLHQMISSEPWQSVPIQLGEVGGILGVLRMNLGMGKQQQDSGAAGAAKCGKSKINLKGMLDEANARSKFRANVTVVNRANLAAKYSSSSASVSGDLPSTGGQSPSQQQLQQAPSGFEPDWLETDRNILTRFHASGNPFRRVAENNNNNNNNNSSNNSKLGGGHSEQLLPAEDFSTNRGADVTSPENNVSYLTEMMSSLLADDSGGNVPSKRSQERTAAMVVTQTSLHGLSKFSGQYLQLMQLMPSAACDVFDGLCHLFDYYLYAVFIGFVSVEDRRHLFAKKTKSTAPPPQQAQDFEALKTCMQVLLNHANHKNNSDKSADSDSNPFISLQLLRELEVPMVVQQKQTDHSSYFALNERIVAAESCWFASKVLSELSTKLVSLVPDDYGPRVRDFISDYQQVADQLRSLIYRTMCPMLIDQASLMNQLVEQSGWDQKKMREEPHEWVDVLVNLCTEVWEYMEDGEEFAEASAQVREQVWLEICQCSFDCVLEGLSRVRKCSTEGRASMTMDISALHTGLNGVHVCRPPRGKQFVDNYVKALYLSDEEIVHWAHQNWQSYSQRHLHGLLNQAMSSVMKKKRLKDSLSALDALYEQDDFEL